MNQKFYLGDPEFSLKMRKLYSWIIPCVFMVMCLLFLIERAWLTALCFLGVVLVSLPWLRSFFEKLHIGGVLKFVICVVLVVLGVLSTGAYI